MTTRAPIIAAGLLCLGWVLPSNADPANIKLDESTRKRCVNVLREGMRQDDFWPAIHAAEGLTLAGFGNEVIHRLKPLLQMEPDDQRRCGLARELVRAGHKEAKQVMLDILAGEDPHGHVHAAESLYKVAGAEDGKAMRKAFQNPGNPINLRLMAAAALGRWGDQRAMKFLRDQMNGPDPDTYRIAAWILGRIGEKSDIARLKQKLPHTPDDFIRCYLEHSLAALGDPGGRKALLRNLESGNGAIRTYAATFAGDARMIEAKSALIGMLNDKHQDAAIRAAQSLLVLAGDPVVPKVKPRHRVKPSLPPTLLLHGTADKVTPFAGAALFRQRMERAGNEIELIPFEGGDHGYFIFDLELFSQAMKQTETFIRKHGMLDDLPR